MDALSELGATPLKLCRQAVAPAPHTVSTWHRLRPAPRAGGGGIHGALLDSHVVAPTLSSKLRAAVHALQVLHQGSAAA